MKKQIVLSLGIMAAAILIAVLLVALRPQPVEKERIEQAPLVETIALQVSDKPLAVLGSGTVEPSEEVTIGAEVSGRLVYVNRRFVEGETVAKGSTLFRIDARDFQNQVRIAQADIAAQNVALLQAEEEKRVAEEELARFAERQKSRNAFAETIDEDDYASRILPPKKQAKGVQQNGSLRSGQSPTSLATREPQLLSEKAARDRAQANLSVARLSLSRTTVKAPFRGLVRSETAAVGTLVQPGQALGTLVATDAFDVRVSLTEDEAALIPSLLRSGTERIPASVYFDYGGLTYRWKAYVDRADSILDPETRTIDVFLRVPNPMRGGVLATGENTDSKSSGSAPPLLLGSFVKAEILGKSPVEFAEIPASALRPGNIIWVIRNNQLYMVKARVLQRTDDVAYIATPSLGEGGRLVTSSLRTPTEGMKVRLASEARKQKAANK